MQGFREKIPKILSRMGCRGRKPHLVLRQPQTRNMAAVRGAGVLTPVGRMAGVPRGAMPKTTTELLARAVVSAKLCCLMHP
jgi:hypothetical protein